MRGAVRLVLVWFLLTGCELVSPTNGYDPETPAAQQAPARVDGTLVLDEAGADAGGWVVELLTTDGSPADSADGAPLRTETSPVDESTNAGVFSFSGVMPGRYRVHVVVADPRFLPPTLPVFSVVAGERVDLGELRFALRSADSLGEGRVTGAVQLSDEASGDRRVRLYLQTANGPQQRAEALTRGAGEFSFVGLPAGLYAVAAERDGYTPAYQLGLRIDDESAEVELLSPLVLHPAGAVLRPALQQSYGEHYTSSDEVPLTVLPFGQMTEMRFSARQTFTDDDGGAVPFAPVSSSATVPLPDLQGRVTVYGEFIVGDGDLAFTSPVYTTSVIRDVTPPVGLSLAATGFSDDDDDARWVNEDGRVLQLRARGSDEHSAVGELALVHTGDNGAGDPASLTFDVVSDGGGEADVSRTLALSPGDGEKIVWLWMRDRAGNLSSPASLTFHVDTRAPEGLGGLTATPSGDPRLPSFSWSEAADPDEQTVAAALRYEIELSTSATFASLGVSGTVTDGSEWTPPLPLPDGAWYWRVRALDLAGNAAVVEAVQPFVVDTKPPLTVSLEALGAALASPAVVRWSLPLDADRAGVRLQLSSSADFSTLLVDDLQADGSEDVTALLSAGASYFVRVAAEDASGNRAPFSVGTFLFDDAAPSLSSVKVASLEDREDATRSTSVTVTLVASDAETSVTSMALSNEPLSCADATYVSFALTSAWTLAAVDGNRTVHVCVRDRAGNTAAAADAILLDRQAPESASIELTGSAGSYSSSRTVSAQLLAVGASEMCITGEIALATDCLESGWRPYATTASVTLLAGDGAKTVTAYFRDLAHNRAQANASITLDETKPAILSVQLDDGAGLSADATATVRVTASDNTSLADVGFARTSAVDDAAWEGIFTREKLWDMNGVDADVSETRSVWVFVKDVAGNVSAATEASLGLDFDDPVLADLSLNEADLNASAPASTSSALIDVYLDATDAAPGLVAEVQISESSAFVGASWLAYQSPVTALLSPANGTKTVYVRVRDVVGRVSAPLSATIVLDDEAPVPSLAAVGTNGRFITWDTNPASVRLEVDEALSEAASLRSVIAATALECAAASYDDALSFVCVGGTCSADFSYDVAAALGYQDGTLTLSACVMDGAGNVSETPAAIDLAFDSSYPSTPANVIVSAASNSVAVEWEAAVDSGPSGLSHYLVRLGTANAGCYDGDANVLETFVVDASSTSYLIKDLDPLTTYRVGVASVDHAGNTSSCAMVTVTTGWRQRYLSTSLGDRKMSSPQLAKGGGYVYLAGKKSHTSGDRLSLWRCPSDDADCGQVSSWGVIYPDPWQELVDLAYGYTIMSPSPRLLVASDRLIAVMTLNVGGTPTVRVSTCPLASDCGSASNWTAVNVEASASILGSTSLDAAVNSTHAFATYYKRFGSQDVRAMVASCPLSTGCDASAEWSVYDLPQPADWTSQAAYGMDANDRAVMVAYGNSSRAIHVSLCDVATGCDAKADWSSGVPPPSNATSGGTCANADIVVGQQKAFLTFQCSSSFSPQRRLSTCDLASGCDTSGEWSTDLNFGSGEGGAPQLHLIDDDLVAAYQLSSGQVRLMRCTDAESNGCANAQGMTMSVGSPAGDSTSPGAGSLGQNPAVVWLDDDQRLRMVTPSVPAARFAGAIPRSGAFATLWAPLASSGGYEALWGQTTSAIDDNVLAVSDSLTASVTAPASPGVLYRASVRTKSVAGERSFVPPPDDVRPFGGGPGNSNWVQTYFSSSAQCETSGREFCADYAAGSSGTRMVMAYNYDSYWPEPCNGYNCPQLYHCDTSGGGCSWVRGVFKPTLPYPFAVTGDDARVYIGLTNLYYTSPQQVGVAVCAWSSGCNDAADFKEHVVWTAASGADLADPALAVGGGRVWLTTRTSAGELTLHHCSTATDCSLAGNWTKNVPLSAIAETSDHGHAVAAGGSSVAVLRSTASGLKYIHCDVSSGCDAAADFTTLTLTASVPTKHTARVALDDYGVATVAALFGGTLEVMSCPVPSGVCASGASWWASRTLANTNGVTFLDVGAADGRRYVLYGDGDNQHLAHCRDRCGDADAWTVGLAHTTSEWSLPRRNNRTLFLAPDASSIGFPAGSRYYSSGNFTGLGVLANGLFLP